MKFNKLGKYTQQQVLAILKTHKGGHSREFLEGIGIPYPPPKGWKKKLLRGEQILPKKAKARKRATNKQKKGYLVAKSFYKTQAWARLRYEAIQRCGAQCGACGRSAADGVTMHVDHIKPIKKYPHLAQELSNLQVLCATCNWGKGNTDETDWREPDVRKLMGEKMG